MKHILSYLLEIIGDIIYGVAGWFYAMSNKIEPWT